MTSRFDSLLWFPTVEPNSSALMRLFCFPYAGGSITVFRNWAKYLPSSIEICPIQLPGRGARFLEPSFQQITPLLSVICKKIEPFLDKPFAFFGHSLGGLIAYELAHRVRSKYSKQPIHLMVSACPAPGEINKHRSLCKLSDKDLITELRQLKGTPMDLLENEELMALTLPTLRADFSLYESYNYTFHESLECPVTVLGGMQDHVISTGKLERWYRETTGEFSFYHFSGDHFFLHSEEAAVLTLIQQKLLSLIYKVA